MTSFEHVFYHDQKVHVIINVLSTNGYKREGSYLFIWYGYPKRNVMRNVFCTKLTYDVRYKRLKQTKTFDDSLYYISQVNKYFR